MSAEVERYVAPVPTVTEREIVLIERQAAILAKSDLVGDLKGKPADIAVVGLQALALGVPFNAAFSELYVIESKWKDADGTWRTKKAVVPSARIRVALARRAGHEVWFTESSPTQATCCLRRRGERRVHVLTATIDEAKAAGLTSKKVWEKFPADMLRATAARKLVALAAQDVMLGIPGADLVTTEYDDVVDDIPDDVLEVGVRSEAPAHEDAPVVLATDHEKVKLLDALDQLEDHQRDWLHKQLEIPGSEPPAYRLPNVRGPHMQASHVKEWETLILAAKQAPGPGPSSEAMQQAFDDARAMQQDDDPERPF